MQAKSAVAAPWVRMLFQVDIRSEGDGWSVQVTDPSSGTVLLAEPRALRACRQGDRQFPLPPLAEAQTLDAGLARDLCLAADDDSRLEDAYRDVLGQQGRVDAFGNYLFLTLLGEELWSRIAAIAQGSPVELALCWPQHMDAFARLPWEMMRSSGGYLAAQSQVAITRRVAGTKHVLTHIESPPRVLFVIGTEPGSDVIRPGAEYLSMLRTLHDEQLGLGLTTRLLCQASTRKLEAVIKEFQPTVVHFICHGDVDDGAGKLQLMDDTAPRQTVWADGEKLYGVLTPDGMPPPSIVVLNACSTGTSGIVEAGRPLAVDLVARGVAVVLGMGGPVADQACRLFTSAFYRALLCGGNLAQAAARGRRAALLHGDFDSRVSAHWALPALFLAKDMGDVGLAQHNQAWAQDRYRVALTYAPPSDPVFCDRLGMFEWFDLLLSDSAHQRSVLHRPTELQSLAIHVAHADRNFDSGQLGRTWLLREFAAHAAREGHVPCLLTSELRGADPWPRTAEELVNFILHRAAMETAELYGVDWGWKEVKVLLDLAEGDPLPPESNDELHKLYNKKPREPRMLAAATRLDLLRLLDAVRTQSGLNGEGRKSRLVLLVDDLHQMGSDAVRAFLDDVLGTFGLRRAAADVRIVFTHSTTPIVGQEQTIKTIVDWFGRSKSTERVLLEPFRKGGEDVLAYKQYLLHWRDDGVRRPLTLGSDTDAAVQAFLGSLCMFIKGVPSKLKETAPIVVKTMLAQPNSPLRPANDEDALKALVADPSGPSS